MKKTLGIILFLLWLFLSQTASQALAVDCSLCNSDTEICTAIGCIDVTTPSAFVGSILTIALGIAGGIAFLLIVAGGIQILASSGNPERIQAGKEMITSAIAGLLLIIFAVFILRIIGVDILQIPGFS